MTRTTQTLLIGAMSGLLLALPACAGNDQPGTSESQAAAMSDNEMRQMIQMIDEHEKEMNKMLLHHGDQMQKMMHEHDEMEKTMKDKAMMQRHRDEMQKIMQSHVEMEKMLQRHREALKKAIPSRGVPSKPGSPQHGY